MSTHSKNYRIHVQQQQLAPYGHCDNSTLLKRLEVVMVTTGLLADLHPIVRDYMQRVCTHTRALMDTGQLLEQIWSVYRGCPPALSSFLRGEKIGMIDVGANDEVKLYTGRFLTGFHCSCVVAQDEKNYTGQQEEEIIRSCGATFHQLDPTLAAFIIHLNQPTTTWHQAIGSFHSENQSSIIIIDGGMETFLLLPQGHASIDEMSWGHYNDDDNFSEYYDMNDFKWLDVDLDTIARWFL